MFTWAQLALTLLQFANNIMRYIDRAQSIKAGTDAEIARSAASVLKQTEMGRQIVAQVNAMSEAQVDAALKELEPK